MRRALAVTCAVLAGAGGTLAAVPLAAAQDATATVAVVVRGADGAELGTVLLSGAGNGPVRVRAALRGLSPGFHGFHLHARGACDPATPTPFSSAGGHYDPAAGSHGAHAGDLPPLFANADGTARVDVVTPRVTLSELLAGSGTAVVVHADPDNLAHVPDRYRHGTHSPAEAGPDAATRATGDAGARLGCGVVTATAAQEPRHSPPGGASAAAVLRSPDGAVAGTVALRDLGGRVQVLGAVTGLAPGFHGFHVHTTGRCDGTTPSPFTSAGGHLAASGGQHGGHDGDLPALLAGADGRAVVDLETDALGTAELLDADGAAVVVHADRDNLAHLPSRYRHGGFGTGEQGPDAATRATGDAGGRVLCGVVESSAGSYAPVTPRRLLDTRTGPAVPLRPGAAPRRVAVASQGARVVAAQLTLTGIAPRADAVVHVLRPGGRTPALQVPGGAVVATSVIAPVDADGTVALHVEGAALHAAVDLMGLFTAAPTLEGGGYTPVRPVRVVEQPGLRLGPGRTADVQLTGRGGVPADHVGAVLVTVTAARASARTFLTAYAAGTPRPPTSILNTGPGRVRATTLAVPVGPDGRVSLHNAGGVTDVLVDVHGWYAAHGAAGGRLVVVPAQPVRTTDDTAAGVPLRLQAGRVLDVQVAGVAGVPVTGARAVVLSVTVSGTRARGHLTAWPTGSALPPTSNANWVAGESTTTRVVVPLGPSGQVSLRSPSDASGLAIEVVGFFDGGEVRPAG